MKILSKNRKARFSYEILEEVEAGIILKGSEIKSLREGGASIGDAYISDKKDGLFLTNANIAPFCGANQFNHDPLRERLLLLHKKQIAKLLAKVRIKGFSMIPLSIYLNHRNYAKVKVALVKGKKLYDKRESIKKRDEERKLNRLK
jgi:SsrA-binding protein|tara:strand:+ start:1955 stop:2392 length:438 start_codon:yes stop_codon:yes gene_type:complete